MQEAKNKTKDISMLPTKSLPRREAATYLRYTTLPNDPPCSPTVLREQQADDIREYAEVHQIDIVKTYVDEGGVDCNELKRLIEEVESGRAKYSVILVDNLTRLTTYALDYAVYKRICRRAGIDLIFVNFDTEDPPSKRFGENIIAQCADMERANKTKYLQGRKSIYGYLMQNVDDELFREFIEGIMVTCGCLEKKIKVRRSKPEMIIYVCDKTSINDEIPYTETDQAVERFIESIMVGVNNLEREIKAIKRKERVKK